MAIHYVKPKEEPLKSVAMKMKENDSALAAMLPSNLIGYIRPNTRYVYVWVTKYFPFSVSVLGCRCCEWGLASRSPSPEYFP